MDAQNYKNCVQKFVILLNFENARKKLLNPQTFLLLFYFVQREDAHSLQIETQFKVKIEDGRETIKKSSIIKVNCGFLRIINCEKLILFSIRY